MTDLVQTPNGWAEQQYPTHCGIGHLLRPGAFLVGWSGTGRTYYCLADGHPTEASRWLHPGGVPSWSGMAPDGGIVRPRNDE